MQRIIALSCLVTLALPPALAQPQRKPLSIAMPAMVVHAPPSVSRRTLAASRKDMRELVRRTYPRTHYERGMYYRQQGDIDNALIEFLKATQENPHLVKAFYEQALIFHERHYLKLAESSLEQALAVKEDYPQARVLLATIRLEQGNVGGAVSELTRSLGLPEPPAAGAPSAPPPQVPVAGPPATEGPAPQPPAQESPGLPPALLQVLHSLLPEPAPAPENEPAPGPPPAPIPENENRASARAADNKQDIDPLLKGIPGVDPSLPVGTSSPITSSPPAVPVSALPRTHGLHLRLPNPLSLLKRNLLTFFAQPAPGSVPADAQGADSASSDSQPLPMVLFDQSAPAQRLDPLPATPKRPVRLPVSLAAPPPMGPLATLAPSAPPPRPRNQGGQPLAALPQPACQSASPARASPAPPAPLPPLEIEIFAPPPPQAPATRPPGTVPAPTMVALSPRRGAGQAAPRTIVCTADQFAPFMPPMAISHGPARTVPVQPVPLARGGHAPPAVPAPSRVASRSLEPLVVRAVTAPAGPLPAAVPPAPATPIVFVRPVSPRARTAQPAPDSRPATARVIEGARAGNDRPAQDAAGRAFTAPSMPSSHMRWIATAQPAQAARKPAEDAWTQRLRYLAQHGTASLKAGEAFMFSEETGEAVLFQRNGETIRRCIAGPRDPREVAMERRPDILRPQELSYNLSLLGKLLPRQSAGPGKPTAAPESLGNISMSEILTRSNGFWDWLKQTVKF